MNATRRTVLQGSAAALATTLVPARARAAAHAGQSVITSNGTATIFPVSHASFVMQTDWGVIYVDPVGEASAYENLLPPDLILVTHEHGDHFNAQLLESLSNGVAIVANRGAHRLMNETLQSRTTELENGQTGEFRDFAIEAIPAYNTTEERLQFHPKGRDNGYVINMPGNFRTYISGDTEDVPEMRSLDDIDLAFVCMNLPFTMDVTAAASAVNDFAPTVVMPYHYRGRDGGTQDPAAFAQMVDSDTKVSLGNWY
jgi:L-ascorbate metabolism protein UlaG (beta-lactamase superfamily)